MNSSDQEFYSGNERLIPCKPNGFPAGVYYNRTSFIGFWAVSNRPITFSDNFKYIFFVSVGMESNQLTVYYC